MSEKTVERMANTCNNYYSCALCPYNPEDISRFIGDKWIGGCPNYDRKLVYAMSKGYRKIDDNCVVITKDELKQYKVQAVKEFAEKLKEKVHNYYPSIDSYCTSRHVILVKDIDELLKEYEE